MRVKQNDGDRVENVIDNPCSYVAWKNKCEELEQQLAEANRALRAETTAHENTQMQLEKLAAENEALKSSLNKIAFTYPLSPHIRGMTTIQTPATDAFMAEMRAQGVEMSACALDDVNQFNYANMLDDLAQKLRKGA